MAGSACASGHQRNGRGLSEPVGGVLAQVGVDGLIPDRDVTLKMARKDLQARNRLPSALLPACSSLSKMHEDSLTEILTRHRPMQTIAAPLCSRVSALVRRLMEQAAQEVHSVEVVGGGSRVPCVAAAVQEGAGQALSRTLDSSSALCQGASLLAALRNPDAAQHGTVPAVAAEPLPEEAGGSGMEASALVAVLAERGRVDRVQLEQALVEAEVNRLEGLISETRRELSDGTLRPKPLDPVPLGYPTGARRLTTRL